MSVGEELERLVSLRDRGVITLEEFEEQRRRVLSGDSDGGDAKSSEPTEPMPPNHMAEAILVTLLCCLPLGIVAIIKASSVQTAYLTGNYELALAHSQEAKQWSMYGLIGGIVVGLVYLVIALSNPEFFN